jgi:hypothetical protein
VLLVAPYDSTPATACVPAFHRHFIYAKRTEAPLVLAPMHILQLWVWERFPELRPALAMAGVLDSADVTRASRWHDVHKALDLGFAHAVYDPSGVATGCADMVFTMAMQQQLGHCCPLHDVWLLAAEWDERALHAVCGSGPSCGAQCLSRRCCNQSANNTSA